MSEQIFSTVEEAILAIKQGKMVIVADNEDRENEGDLVCSAELITPEIINFMATEARGLICMPVSREIAARLDLHPMTVNNTDTEGTAFTVSIDGAVHKGVGTGISAEDRAKTIKLCLESNTNATDLRRPGHIFPLIAREGGVLVRQGQTEASVDLSIMAGLQPAGVICEIANPDGSMARREQLAEFSKKHNMPYITVAQMVEYRRKHEKLIQKQAEAKLPTQYGEFKVIGYQEKYTNNEIIVMTYGDISSEKNPIVRVHSECLTGDSLGSLRCDCRSHLNHAQELIAQHGSGILIYLRQEGRGIGLMNKLKAYQIQDELGLDTYDANQHLGFEDDYREYWSAYQVLSDMGIAEVRLITNNPTKIAALEKYGIKVTERINYLGHQEYNHNYLLAKKERKGHLINL